MLELARPKAFSLPPVPMKSWENAVCLVRTSGACFYSFVKVSGCSGNGRRRRVVMLLNGARGVRTSIAVQSFHVSMRGYVQEQPLII